MCCSAYAPMRGVRETSSPADLPQVVSMAERAHTQMDWARFAPFSPEKIEEEARRIMQRKDAKIILADDGLLVVRLNQSSSGRTTVEERFFYAGDCRGYDLRRAGEVWAQRHGVERVSPFAVPLGRTEYTEAKFARHGFGLLAGGASVG